MEPVFDTDLQARPDETAFMWARRTGHYSRILICGCCLIIEANGDRCGNDECETCRDGGLYERAWLALTGRTLTLGDFTDECGHDLADDAQAEAHSEECERYGFAAWPCGLCGASCHGDRHRAVLWPREIPEQYAARCTCDPCASCRMRLSSCCKQCAFCDHLEQSRRAR
jgi:hypothetical protein